MHLSLLSPWHPAFFSASCLSLHHTPPLHFPSSFFLSPFWPRLCIQLPIILLNLHLLFAYFYSWCLLRVSLFLTHILLFLCSYLCFSPSAFNQATTFLHRVSYQKHRGMISTRDNSFGFNVKYHSSGSSCWQLKKWSCWEGTQLHPSVHEYSTVKVCEFSLSQAGLTSFLE